MHQICSYSVLLISLTNSYSINGKLFNFSLIPQIIQ